MSDVSIKTWVNQEKSAYEDFNEYVANTIEDGMFRALAEKMHRDLKTADISKVTLPWGTYRAEMKDRGENGVVNISWEPSEGFLKMLNDDSDSAEKYEMNYQDEFDPEFVKLFWDYVAWGSFDPDTSTKNRGIKMEDPEVAYFLNGYASVLYNVAKDKQRDGKTYRLEIDNNFPHGSFDFEYDGDEIKVKFIAHKVFKQYLKDDKVAAVAVTADYTPITETRVERVPNKEKKAA